MNAICSIFGPIFDGFGSVFGGLRSLFASLGAGFVGDMFYQIYLALLSLAESVSGCNFGS